MPQNKASFHSTDLSPVTSGSAAPGTRKYMGPERRRTERRQEQDRRNDVRFDLNSSDRRENAGRRETDVAPKFW